MERRKLGKAGLEVGVIGLGTEHLQRNQETMAGVLGAAVDAGVGYIDLLYLEPDYWDAYGRLFRAYRDKLVLAAHWSSGPEYDLDFCRRTFADVLARVGNDHIEVAMMTMIDDGERKGSAWREASLEVLHRYQEQGRLDLIGGSAHDPVIALQAVNSGLVDVLMFPINMIGLGNEKEEALIQACADRGVSLVAMKPYHGGTLLSIDGQPTGITPSQCLSYMFSLPVATAVPGPKTLAEWKATLRYAEASAEEKDYRPILDTLYDRLAGHCVYCHHCLPCPEGIEVGWLLWCVDMARGAGAAEYQEFYDSYPVKASACVDCGICVERCPFGVDIMAKLREAVALFETQVC